MVLVAPPMLVETSRMGSNGVFAGMTFELVGRTKREARG